MLLRCPLILLTTHLTLLALATTHDRLQVQPTDSLLNGHGAHGLEPLQVRHSQNNCIYPLDFKITSVIIRCVSVIFNKRVIIEVHNHVVIMQNVQDTHLLSARFTNF